MNKEVERIKWFIPVGCNGIPYGKKAIKAEEAFILFSERGIKTPLENIEDPYKYRQLLEGKRWQGIHIQMWEDGIMDSCCLGYWTLLGGEDPKEVPPEYVVKFMSTTMFKGHDKDMILRVYEEIIIEDLYCLNIIIKQAIERWTWWRRLLFKFL